MPDFCPPLPAYLEGFGINACDYVQMSPMRKEQLHQQALASRNAFTLFSRYPQTQFQIGGIDMLRTTSLGRPLLDSSAMPLSSLPAINKKQNVSGRRYLGSGNAFSFDNIRDIWSAQVIALWLTNGKAFDQYNMSGIVTLNGHRPSNLGPLNVQSSGRVAEDLSRILKKMPSAASSRGTKFVMGPDGIYGPAFDSIIAEYVRTGKAFGASIPANVKPVFDRLASNWSSAQIDAAKSSLDKTPKTQAADTPASALTGDAQKAAGFNVTKPLLGDTFLQKPGSSSPIAQTPPKTPLSKDKEGKTVPTTTTTSDDNTMLWVAGGGLALIAGGFGYLIYKKRKGER